MYVFLFGCNLYFLHIYTFYKFILFINLYPKYVYFLPSAAAHALRCDGGGTPPLALPNTHLFGRRVRAQQLTPLQGLIHFSLFYFECTSYFHVLFTLMYLFTFLYFLLSIHNNPRHRFTIIKIDSSITD